MSPEGAHAPISVMLDFDVTNNVTEYEACIIELQSAIKIGLKNVKLYGDSSLIINQIS